MKKSKLGRKIFILMLLITVGTCATLFAVAFSDITELKNSSIELNNELGESSAAVTEEGIIKEMNSALMQITAAKAKVHDASFNNINNEIQILARAISAEYKYLDNADARGEIPPHPADTEDGVLMGRSALAPWVDSDERIISEQRLISGIEPTILSIYETSGLAMNVMVGTKSGIFYRYSDYNTYDDSYDVTVRPWYTSALENPGEVVWSEAYTDAYGKMVVTASCAYTDDKGEFAGVVASDIKIQTILDDVLLSDRIGNGFAFIIDRNGKYLAHPGLKDENFNKDPLADGDPAKVQIVKQMVAGGTGKASFDGDTEKIYLFYAPIKTTGWSYGMHMPASSMTEPVVEATSVIKDGTDQAQSEMNRIIREMLNSFMIVFVVIIVIIMIASFGMALSIIKPVNRMVEGTKEIGQGNLDHEIEIKGKDELAFLGNSINSMASELKTYIEELTNVTAEKERIGAELNVATQIQANMLPSIFPAFPGRKEFDIYATMTPAKEVGGDFYDFFLSDDNHLAIVMADVSGKGVPAALFMVIAKTLIKNRSQLGGSPSEILADVNKQLLEGNEAELFVTVWLAIIEISTGKALASNAGHEYPAIKRKDGEFELIKNRHSPALATIEDINFRQVEFELNPGDRLFVYTDGVPEATNAHDELFGTDRMLDSLNRNKDAAITDILKGMKEDIDSFVDEAPQFDDVTMLCFDYLGVSVQ